MSGLERENTGLSPDKKPSLPSTWEEVCRREIFFNDKRLAEFPEKFLHFYHTQVENPDHKMKNYMDDILKSARENYSPEDAENIIKMYVFSCVLTQNNERKGKYGESQQFRKNEYDSQHNPLPAYVHPTRMLVAALNEKPSADLAAVPNEPSKKKKGVNAITAMAIAGHDLVEDCEMTIHYTDDQGNQIESLITGKKIGKTTGINDLIKAEFPDIGNRVTNQIDAVTKYEQFPLDFEKAMNLSGLKLFLYSKLLPRRGTSTMTRKEKDSADKDIEKAIASIYKIRAVPHTHYQDQWKLLNSADPDFQAKRDALLDEYYQDIVSGIYIKCRDTLDNSKGLSKASQIRARQLATLARLVGFYEISNDLMIMLAQQKETPFKEDSALAGIAATLTKKQRETYNTQLQNFFFKDGAEDNIGIPTSVETGLRIAFSDENTDSSPDAAVPQAIITVPSRSMDTLLYNLETYINRDEFKSIIGESGELTYRVYGGILEKATRIWGREGFMVRIVGKDKKTVFYLRFVDDKPRLSDYIMQGRNPTDEKSPEESIFRRTPLLNESVSMEQKLLHAALFYLYPQYLKDFKPQKGPFSNLYIVVFDTGFTTIKGLQSAEKINKLLGLGLKNPVIKEFQEENGEIIDLEKDPKFTPKLPIIRLTEQQTH